MRWLAALVLLAGCSGSTRAVRVTRPTVLAVYALAPDSIVHRDEVLASAYDQLMYYWSEARPRLDSLGVAHDERALTWDRPVLPVCAGGRCRRLALTREVAIGYVLAAPGREPRLITGLLMDEELADSVRAYLAGAAEPVR